MAQRLKLHILDGPLIGQVFDVPAGRCSIGGRGSDADLELAGLPHGVRYVELVEGSGAWTITEYDQRTAMLNQKPLKRRDKLKNDDVIFLPSMAQGQAFRMKVETELYKARKQRETPKINPLYLVGGGVYALVMVAAVLFFAMGDTGGASARALTMEDVNAALQADIDAAVERTPRAAADVLLDETPATYRDLAIFLGSTAPETRKTEMSRAYRDGIVAMFSDAWRLERQGRSDEAADLYQQIARMMGDRDLRTTDLALRRLNAIR